MVRLLQGIEIAFSTSIVSSPSYMKSGLCFVSQGKLEFTTKRYFCITKCSFFHNDHFVSIS